MTTMPHDYYLKFTDSEVLSDIQAVHNKGNYTLHSAFKHMSYLHSLTPFDLDSLTGKELHLYPDMNLSTPLHRASITHHALMRNESCVTFKKSNIAFSTIEQLISPLLNTHPTSHKRGYPSGGALYPVEVFICSLNESPEHWPFVEKVLHLLPYSRALETVQNTLSSKHLKDSILCPPSTLGTPALALVYVAYWPKTLFKYRYRGYRLALMEAGSMYMLIELQAKALDLRCRLWSGFTDSMLCKSLGLNPALFSPLCVHFIGQGK